VVVFASMELIPLGLQPSDDLKQSLESWIARETEGSAWIVSGIGSLTVAQLRLAGRTEASVLDRDLEILTLQGSLCRSGSHIHITVADANGAVLGGHLCEGSVVRTTAEVLVARLPQWQLQRAVDPTTGYRELEILPRFTRSLRLRWREWCSRKVSR
jgi:predicted DNA-binding protein with PD1-like motif